MISTSIIFSIISIFLILLIFGAYIVFFRKQKKLTKKRGIFYAKQIFHTQKLNGTHAVMEIHKIFIQSIFELYQLPKKTKAVDAMRKIIHNLPESLQQDCWYFHRLRNRAAHQVGIKITKKEAGKCRNIYAQALSEFTEK